MGKFRDRAKSPEVELLKICGVQECSNKSDVLIGYKKVPRCAYHYQRDVDIYRGRRKSASSYVYDMGMPMQ